MSEQKQLELLLDQKLEIKDILNNTTLTLKDNEIENHFDVSSSEKFERVQITIKEQSTTDLLRSIVHEKFMGKEISIECTFSSFEEIIRLIDPDYVEKICFFINDLYEKKFKTITIRTSEFRHCKEFYFCTNMYSTHLTSDTGINNEIPTNKIIFCVDTEINKIFIDGGCFGRLNPNVVLFEVNFIRSHFELNCKFIRCCLNIIEREEFYCDTITFKNCKFEEGCQFSNFTSKTFNFWKTKFDEATFGKNFIVRESFEIMDCNKVNINFTQIYGNVLLKGETKDMNFSGKFNENITIEFNNKFGISKNFFDKNIGQLEKSTFMITPHCEVNPEIFFDCNGIIFNEVNGRINILDEEARKIHFLTENDFEKNKLKGILNKSEKNKLKGILDECLEKFNQNFIKWYLFRSSGERLTENNLIRLKYIFSDINVYKSLSKTLKFKGFLNNIGEDFFFLDLVLGWNVEKKKDINIKIEFDIEEINMISNFDEKDLKGEYIFKYSLLKMLLNEIEKLFNIEKSNFKNRIIQKNDIEKPDENSDDPFGLL